MNEPFNSQRDKEQSNQSHESDKFKTIEILNTDCLEHIFQFLPMVDLFKIQRVCKHWKMLSLDLCHRMSRLEMTRNFWGVSSDCNIHIDLAVLVKVLQICGSNLYHIGLSNDEDSYPVQCRRIHVESDKKLWILIQNKCPAINSIDFGQSRSPFALKFASNSFKNLTYFRMKKFLLPKNSPLDYETHLCDLFSNNENLKRVHFFDATMTAECLTKLNPNNLLELSLEKCMIRNSKFLIKALERMKNLQKLTLLRCSCESGFWLNDVLESLDSISDSLKYLDFFLYNPGHEEAYEENIAKLKHLEYLSVAGESINGNELFRYIVESCKKLKTIEVHYCSMIEDGDFHYLEQLPMLQNLVLDNLSRLSDKSMVDLMDITNLTIRRCTEFKKDGILDFIRNSKNIRSLKIFHCENINGDQIIEEGEQCSNANLEIIVDNSETNSDYFKWISKLRKSNGRITKEFKKICCDCFVESTKNLDCRLCCNVIQSYFRKVL